MKHACLSVLALGILSAASSAFAQAPPESLVACARIVDPGQRLRCYDTEMTGMGVVVAGPPTVAAPVAAPAPAVPPPAMPPPAAAPTPAAPPAAVAAAAPPAAAPPESKFGAEELKREKRPKEVKADKVMESAIASIKEVRPKLFLIVLANGQIWMQDGTQITSFFRAGYTAHIEKGVFGDYRMSTHETGDKNMVRVTRIQ